MIEPKVGIPADATGILPGTADEPTAAKNTMEMLGIISHELKNPATAMLMTAQTLADGRLGRLTAPQQAATERIISTGRYLVDLIGEYLDLVRLEDSELEAHPEVVDDFLAMVVEPALEMTAPAVAEAGMRVIQHLPGRLGAVHCDPDMMQIVLSNLLSNAAKYGRDEGVIRLSIYRLPRRLELSVYNDGPGFTAADKPRLFRKFSRLDDPQHRARRGSGVGLYACRRIVTMHDGSISAASEHGRWAEFTVSIPQRPSE